MYVGSPSCLQCHPQQTRAWQPSHHAKSMQAATPENVLGDFDDAVFESRGHRSRFFRRGGKFWVNTEGPDGGRQDFEIRYTFGLHPLQQYLIELAGGRLQALGIAWDARGRDQGGQRWYALYPEEPPAPADALHWTGRDQNWNFMCASCHSTGLEKNFDLARQRYATRWAEINVACEACHGPGGKHLAWAKARRAGKAVGTDPALTVDLRASRGVTWEFAGPGQKIATPRGDVAAAKRAEEICYGCHSRRQEIVAKPTPGAPFLDNYLPGLLEKNQYHPDGQIDGEVFEYGSFVQSPMHRAGVTCGDCHESHSQKLRAEGNALCSQCHRAEHYDRPAHHRHGEGSAGGQCVECHMPPRTYMGVHVRRDHGLRIPRPDLSVDNPIPNACNQCHQDKDAPWAASRLADWRGGPPQGGHFAPVMAAALSGQASLPRLLALLAGDWPGFVRGAALGRLPPTASRQSLAAIGQAARDPDPLVRIGAARALPTLPPAAAAGIGAALLADPRRAVRIEAARALAGIPPAVLTGEQAKGLEAGLEELFRAENAAADRPESHVNRGQILGRLGRIPEADAAFQTALDLAPDFVPALVNRADLYRATGRDAEGEALLRRAASQSPASAEPAHALGLFLIRRGRIAEALPWLRQAMQLDGGNGRLALAYALALAASGGRETALGVLEEAARQFPGDASIVEARSALAQQIKQAGAGAPE